MRTVDYYYFTGIEKVLKEGVEQEVRAEWNNGKNAVTRSISQLFYKFDDIEDFPITNYRKINYKKAYCTVFQLPKRLATNISPLL